MSNIRNEGLTYDIQATQGQDTLTAKLKYNGFESGAITSNTLDGIESQFQTIASLLEGGAMLRHNCIMLGYHNDDLSGDVLLTDGEVIGSWQMDDEEWCHFTLEGNTEIECSAPSPWLLHDLIAKRFKLIG